MVMNLRYLGNAPQLILLSVVLFAAEMIFYFVPGVSLSSLIIGFVAMKLGFTMTFVISLVAIESAHLILRKGDFSVLMPGIATLAPMVAFATFAGPWIVNTLGWGLYGVSIGLTKWGFALLAGHFMGRNMPKRLHNVVLEPVLNYFIFWKMHAILGILF
jgi:hypothetical protein